MRKRTLNFYEQINKKYTFNMIKRRKIKFHGSTRKLIKKIAFNAVSAPSRITGCRLVPRYSLEINLCLRIFDHFLKGEENFPKVFPILFR